MLSTNSRCPCSHPLRDYGTQRFYRLLRRPESFNSRTCTQHPDPPEFHSQHPEQLPEELQSPVEWMERAELTSVSVRASLSLLGGHYVPNTWQCRTIRRRSPYPSSTSEHRSIPAIWIVAISFVRLRKAAINLGCHVGSNRHGGSRLDSQRRTMEMKGAYTGSESKARTSVPPATGASAAVPFNAVWAKVWETAQAAKAKARVVLVMVFIGLVVTSICVKEVVLRVRVLGFVTFVAKVVDDLGQERYRGCQPSDDVWTLSVAGDNLCDNR